MNNKLSHSQANKFTDCAKSWEFHYVNRLRPLTTSSALLFGTALDDAVEVYLQTGDHEKAREMLDDRWFNGEINNEIEYLPTSPKLVYANSDYDKDLLMSDDIENLVQYYGDDVMERFNVVKKQKGVIGYSYLKKDDKILFNHVNWFSMYRKGILMLEKAMEVIDENVEDVICTQKKVEITNDDGDSIVGYIDFIVKWKDIPAPVLFDLKTSSIQYEEDSVKTSQQLSLYLHALANDEDLSDVYNGRLAGYFVLHKRIKKNKVKLCIKCGHDGSGARFKTCNNEIDGSRCGGTWQETINAEVTHQLIVDEVPQRLENIVIENMDAVNQGIKTGIYPRNLQACVKPWGKCAYYDLCYSEKMDGLMELPEKEKK